MNIKLIFILALSFALSGCFETEGVTTAHWNKASEMCAGVNGGVLIISRAEAMLEYKSCGFKCSEETGRAIYEEDFRCNNGARFSTRFIQ